MLSGIKQNKYILQNLKHNRTYTLLLQAGNVVGYGKPANVTVSTLQAGKLVIHSFVHFIHSIHSFQSFIHSFLPFISFVHFIHSFIHSFVHSFIHSFIRSFVRSFNSLTHSLTHSFIHSFISFIHSFIHSTVTIDYGISNRLVPVLLWSFLYSLSFT